MLPSNVVVSPRSSPGLDWGRCLAALLPLAALASATAVAQQTPQPVFTELFAYDPGAPSQLLGKWLISSQLDGKLQPLRVGVVVQRSGSIKGYQCNGASDLFSMSPSVPLSVLIRS